MIIIGADFHPAYQEIASVNTDSGEYQEKRFAHPKEAEEFYRGLASDWKTAHCKGEDRVQRLAPIAEHVCST